MLEDLITFSDLLFSEMTEPQAPNLLPPGSGLSRTGVISFHPVDDGPHPGSSRTRVQIVNADTTTIQRSPADQLVVSPEAMQGGTVATARSRQASGDEALIVVDPPARSEEPESTMPKRSFTEDSQLDLLFDPGLIPASMRDGLPDEYHVSCCCGDVESEDGGLTLEGTAAGFRRSPPGSFRPVVDSDQLACPGAVPLHVAVRVSQVSAGHVLRRRICQQDNRRAGGKCDTGG